MIKACISGAPLPIETVAAMLRSDIAPSDLDACLINADIEDRHLLAHHVADFMDPADGDSRWWEVLFSLVEQGVRFDARDVLRRAFKGKKRNKPKHDQIRTLMGLLNCRQEDMMIIELDGEGGDPIVQGEEEEAAGDADAAQEEDGDDDTVAAQEDDDDTVAAQEEDEDGDGVAAQEEDEDGDGVADQEDEDGDDIVQEAEDDDAAAVDDTTTADVAAVVDDDDGDDMSDL
jgi:hypothetical protein